MLEKMSEMIAEQLNCDAETITADTSFKDDLGADSLDLFGLVMALEDEYNIEIPAEDDLPLLFTGNIPRGVSVNKVHRKPENFSAKSCECIISVHCEARYCERREQ